MVTPVTRTKHSIKIQVMDPLKITAQFNFVFEMYRYLALYLKYTVI